MRNVDPYDRRRRPGRSALARETSSSRSCSRRRCRSCSSVFGSAQAARSRGWCSRRCCSPSPGSAADHRELRPPSGWTASSSVVIAVALMGVPLTAGVQARTARHALENRSPARHVVATLRGRGWRSGKPAGDLLRGTRQCWHSLSAGVARCARENRRGPRSGSGCSVRSTRPRSPISSRSRRLGETERDPARTRRSSPAGRRRRRHRGDVDVGLSALHSTEPAINQGAPLNALARCGDGERMGVRLGRPDVRKRCGDGVGYQTPGTETRAYASVLLRRAGVIGDDDDRRSGLTEQGDRPVQLVCSPAPGSTTSTSPGRAREAVASSACVALGTSPRGPPCARSSSRIVPRREPQTAPEGGHGDARRVRLDVHGDGQDPVDRSRLAQRSFKASRRRRGSCTELRRIKLWPASPRR